MRPTAKEINSAKMIGKNKFMFSVVSSIMMAREKDRRVYPDRTAAAPIVPYVAGDASWLRKVDRKSVIIRPSEHPIRMPGRNKPAGTKVPKHRMFIRYQIKKWINSGL